MKAPLILLTATFLLISLTTLPTQAEDRAVLAADYHKKRIAIINPDGAIHWEHPVRNIHDLHQLPNGNILFQTDWTQLLEMAPDKKLVWSYDAATQNGNAGKRVEVHAFQRLDNGLTMIAESGTRRIIEVDKNGVIHHQIPLKLDHPDPHRDTRMARKLANGHYLVCHEKDAAVREYDSEGKVVWEYNTGTKLYGAVRLHDGNTLIGTGDGHSVLEVNRTGEVVWKIDQNDLPGIRLEWVTNVGQLPNGNIVFGNCHAGPSNPQIIEVTRSKKVISFSVIFSQMISSYF